MEKPFTEEQLKVIGECRTLPQGHKYEGRPKTCIRCGISRRQLRKYGLANEFLQNREVKPKKKKNRQINAPAQYKRKRVEEYDDVA